MAYNEQLANRVRDIIAEHKPGKVEEKKMFGGLCFMVNGKMCVVIRPDSILVRIDPGEFDKAVEKKELDPMLHIGRQMSGFGYVSEDLLRTAKQLGRWVKLALEYNKLAKSSKKKSGKS
jgi:TfoX/Sxy family transcriptional regulator of competence genes